MSETPKVSILVPVYNAEPYLNRAVDSILAQTFTDFELILIDDGSTDRSGVVIDEYKSKDPRIVVLHKENEGVARTLNRGLAMARGEYIRRFDADDTCIPSALQHQVNFLESHPDIALVSTQQAFQTTSGKIAWNYRTPHNRYFAGESYRVVKPREIYDLVPIVHGTVLVRKNVIDQVGSYRPEFLTSEDQDLWLRICECYPIAILNECSYFVRIHPGSATRRYARTINFYLDLTWQFHMERLCKGTDPLQRGESMPRPPEIDHCDTYLAADGTFGRTVHPQLDFMYRLLLDAGDWVNVFVLALQGLKSGWRRAATYRMLLFPLMGESVIQRGVEFKSLLRKGLAAASRTSSSKGGK